MKRLMLILAACFCVAAGPTTRPATPTTRPVAKRIVYLVDGSGSMMNVYDNVRTEVVKRVGELPADAKFNVLIFSEDMVIARTKAMEPATAENKERVRRFVDKSAPHGSDDLVMALQAAFEQQPDEVWLFSDGDYDTKWPAIFAEAQRLTRGKRIAINTFVASARTEANEGSLILLARKCGGVCIGHDGKVVPESREVTGWKPEPPPPPVVKRAKPPKPEPDPDSGVRLK